ncbi:hypothetical protein L2E82_19774 [Cichorium intybus]|uniref:Uncharacterized protein n=1 Tax=Cichorium intybus TaxID=13427 RepID=A0ACB9DRI5_CICIN|nr:hypothetical protein L2E82_19774 [Cichorium intybus]
MGCHNTGIAFYTMMEGVRKLNLSQSSLFVRKVALSFKKNEFQIKEGLRIAANATFRCNLSFVRLLAGPVAFKEGYYIVVFGWEEWQAQFKDTQFQAKCQAFEALELSGTVVISFVSQSFSLSLTVLGVLLDEIKHISKRLRDDECLPS